jgi:hypothetical protein
MTRREFSKAGVSFAFAAIGLEMIGGCATTETPKVTTLIYPPLPYQKIQPPQDGCLVGFFKEPDASIHGITYLEKALSAKPSIIIIAGSKLYREFPMTQAIMVAKRGIVPYVHVDIAPFDSRTPIPGFSVKEIAQGQQDSHIKKVAQDVLEFGKGYGGFFFSTMVDMNTNSFCWGMNSKFIPAWRRIWQIFDDQGANQYTTWVWVPYSPEAAHRQADDPELYYPGDKYVDWIGLNAFSVAGHPKTDYMFNVLIGNTYRRLFKYHPEKPFVIPWFARTNDFYQSRWLVNTYRSIKDSFPAIKAAMYCDRVSSHTGDHTLNPKSLETLKEILKDPYWIMAK